MLGNLYGKHLAGAGFDSPQLLQFMESADVSELVEKLERNQQHNRLHLKVLHRALKEGATVLSERRQSRASVRADQNHGDPAAGLGLSPGGGGNESHTFNNFSRLPDITESSTADEADEEDGNRLIHKGSRRGKRSMLISTHNSSSNQAFDSYDSILNNGMGLSNMPSKRALTGDGPLPMLRASASRSSIRRMPSPAEESDVFKPNAFRDQKMKRSISSVVNYTSPNYQSHGGWSRSGSGKHAHPGGEPDDMPSHYHSNLSHQSSEISFPELHSGGGGASAATPSMDLPQSGRSRRLSNEAATQRGSSFGGTKGKRPSIASPRRLSFDKTYNSYKSFVPRQLLRGIGDCVAKGIMPRVRCESLKGAILFADASGFTALTTTLAEQHGKDAAAKLCEILNRFFMVIIDMVNLHGGDVIKFSGDALTILFRAPGNVGSSPKSPLQEATRQAALCAWDIHHAIGGAKGFLGYQDPRDSRLDVYMSLHMGLGCGDLTGLVVGGAFARKEYILTGPPLEQISIAEPLANSGETVASPEAWVLISSYFTGTDITETSTYTEQDQEARLQHARFMRLDTKVEGLDVMDPVASEFDGYTQDILDEVKQFIPGAVRERITAGQDGRLAEMLSVSVIFVNVKGINLHAVDDADSPRALKMAQRLMLRVQESCYRSEGSINKALMDDKGLLIVCAFGLPGCYHMDDAARAIILAKDLSQNIHRVTGDGTISSSIGVASGVAYCGPVGSHDRREYTMMGTVPNLAARLMSKAGDDGVLIDKRTLDSAKGLSGDVSFEFESEWHEMKGLGSVEVFRPSLHQKPVDLVDKTKAEKNAILEKLIYGRNLELQRLRRIVYDLKVQRGGGLMLSGNKGCGKSLIVKMLEITATNYGLTVMKASSKKDKAKKTARKGYMPRALPKKVEAELEYYFDLTLGEKLNDDQEQQPEIYEVWHTIVQQCIVRGAKHNTCTTTEWVHQVLRSWNDGMLLKDAAHLNCCLAHGPIETLPSNPAQQVFDHSDYLSESGRRLLVGRLILAVIITLAKHIGTTMIVLHFQVGSDWHMFQNQYADSWNVLRDLVRYPKSNVIVCLVARLFTPAHLDGIPALDEVMHLCIKQSTYIPLANLNKFQRREFAAALMSHMSGHKVEIQDIPEVLAQFLSDRAAGNPKLVMDVLYSLTTGYKNYQYIPIINFRPNATNVEVARGMPLVEVLADHKVQINLEPLSRLNQLPVQVTLINFVESDFNAMSNPMQELMKAVSVYAHSFTATMLASVMCRRLIESDSVDMLEYITESLADLVDMDYLDDVTRGLGWVKPYASVMPTDADDEMDNYEWQCLVSRDLGWVAYDTCQKGRNLNESMNFSYHSVPKRELMFQMGDRDYMIDWSRMVQRNIRSGTERPIRFGKEKEMDFSEEDWHEAPLEPRYDYSSMMMKDLVRSRLLQKERADLERLWQDTTATEHRSLTSMQGVVKVIQATKAFQAGVHSNNM